MIQQQVITKKQPCGKLIDFLEYKKMKPFFRRPIKISLGNPINDTYYLEKNVVYKGKQILAMKQKLDSKTIILVEAKIENGQLIHISKLSEELLDDISVMLEKTI